MRQQKIARQIQRDMADIFSKEAASFLQGAMVTVTAVRVSPDFGYAKIYVSVLDKSQEKDVLKGLKSAGGFLRRELGSALGLRYTPELIFEADDSIAYGAHILEVMHDVEKADAQRRIDHPESAGETEE